MIEYLKGIVAVASIERVVVEVGGIGYSLSMPLSAIAALPPPGEAVHLFVAEVIREESHDLYAFIDEGQRDFFLTLSSVSGIGPKTALAALGHFEAGDLCAAILEGDGKSIAKVPGIGKKTAERLIVELRDRVAKLGLAPTAATPEEGAKRDAIQALITLGYAPLQAQQAVKAAAGTTSDVSQLLSAALSQL